MRAFGSVLFFTAGLLMFAFEVYWFWVWWGGVGLIVGVAIPPIAALFPFIYLFMEGFSLVYFGIWGVGILGAVLRDRAE